jgi:hypothetical protein
MLSPLNGIKDPRAGGVLCLLAVLAGESRRSGQQQQSISLLTA